MAWEQPTLESSVGRPHLFTSAQFAADTAKNGGATYNVHQGQAIHLGDSGYMVGQHGGLPSENVGPHLTPSKSEEFFTTIARHGKGGYAGSWKQDDGDVVLDASTRYDTLKKGAKSMIGRNEDALFDMKKGQSVYNPKKFPDHPDRYQG